MSGRSFAHVCHVSSDETGHRKMRPSSYRSVHRRTAAPAYKLIPFLAQRSFARERQIAQHHIGDFQHAFEVEANVVVDRYAPSRAARTLFREAIVFIVVQSKESDRFRE